MNVNWPRLTKKKRHVVIRDSFFSWEK